MDPTIFFFLRWLILIIAYTQPIHESYDYTCQDLTWNGNYLILEGLDPNHLPYEDEVPGLLVYDVWPKEPGLTYILTLRSNPCQLK